MCYRGGDFDANIRRESLVLRLNLRLTGMAESLITDMAEQLGVSPKEVILDALGVYHVATSELMDGKQIGVLDPRSKELMAITTPTLSMLTKKIEETRKSEQASAAKELG